MSDIGESSTPTTTTIELATPSGRYQSPTDSAGAEKLWSGVSIPSTAIEARKALKKAVRKGMMESRRREVWLAMSGASELMKTKPQLFAGLFNTHFQDRLPPPAVKTPCLGGVDYSAHGSRTPDVVLDDDSLQSWRRVMFVFSAEHPEIRFCPAISDLVALALLYCADEEAFAFITCLVSPKTVDNRSFVVSSDAGASLFALTFSDLIRLRLGKVAKRMESLGVDPLTLAGQWFPRNFLGTLPISVALRVADLIVSEGLKAAYRVGLALLKGCQKEILDASDAPTVISRIRSHARACDDAAALFKPAFALYLSRKHAERFNAVHAGHELEALGRLELERGASKAVFRRPVMDQPSAILSGEEFDVMWSWLGEAKGLKDARRLFCTADDGYLLTTLLERSRGASPTFIVVKAVGAESGAGAVFGAYVTAPWQLERGYFGTGESFAFTLRPAVAVFPWAGENEFFQSCKPGRLAVGAAALALNGDLNEGCSQPCSTFGTHRPLSGESDAFTCAHVEVWGLV